MSRHFGGVVLGVSLLLLVHLSCTAARIMSFFAGVLQVLTRETSPFHRNSSSMSKDAAKAAGAPGETHRRYAGNL